MLELSQIGKVCHKKCAIYYLAGDCIIPREGIFFEVVTGGTDNHLMLADVYSRGRTGAQMQDLLDAANITANKNTIPNETQSVRVTSGVRLGTAAVTTRGFTEADMVEVADLINLAVRGFDAQKQNIDARVAALCKKHPIYESRSRPRSRLSKKLRRIRRPQWRRTIWIIFCRDMCVAKNTLRGESVFSPIYGRKNVSVKPTRV